MGLKVNEIFYSLQGESSLAGRPCIFVRLSGCNLRCAYCDTKYAYEAGEEMDVDRVLDNIRRFNCGLVEITGGEPLLQPETPALVRKLIEQNYTVMLETNGSLDIGTVDPRCIKVVDVKCPSSGEQDQNLFANLEKLCKHDELKFVVETKEDYQYAKEQLLRNDIALPPGHIHFSPVFGKLSPQTLSAWILEDNLNVRMTLQMHKLIWPNKEKGV